MANEINVKMFDDQNDLFDCMALDVERDILKTVEKDGGCSILLSGGSTPRPVYERIGRSLETMNAIKWGLIDDRFVGAESDYSNERMIRETLGRQIFQFLAWGRMVILLQFSRVTRLLKTLGKVIK